MQVARPFVKGVHGRLAAIAVAVFAGLSAGCGKLAPSNTDAMRKEVLAADPAFSDVLSTRDDLANRIGVIDRELALKRTQTEREIGQLRAQLQASTKSAKENIAAIRALIVPAVERVNAATAKAQEELKTKRQQRAALGKSVSELRKALKRQDSPLTDAERTRMDKELTDLLAEIQRLDGEIASIQQHLALLKQKRLLLRL